MAENKIPQWLEALLGPGVDFFTHPILESFTNNFLQQEERDNLEDVRTVYWVRLNDPTTWATIRATLVGAFTLTGVMTAKLSEFAGPLRDILDEVIEQPINSMPRIIDTVIERRAKAMAFPEGYTVSSGEAMKAIAGIFETRMLEDLRTGVQRQIQRFLPAKASLERAGDAHLRILTTLPMTRQLEIVDWFSKADEPTKEKYLRCLAQLNETKEIVRFYLMKKDEREAWIEYVFEIRKFRFPLTPQELKEYQEIYTKFTDKYLRPNMAEAASWLRAENLKLNPNYKEAKVTDWKTEFYSPANLKKYPHRHRTLPSGDPRRTAYDQRQEKLTAWRNWVLLGSLPGLWLIMNGSGQHALADLQTVSLLSDLRLAGTVSLLVATAIGIPLGLALWASTAYANRGQ